MTRALSWFFSLVALLALGAVVGLFAWQSVPVWQQEGWGYLSGVKWFFRQHQFGALPMIYGSLVVALVALLLAAPVGFGAAIFTAEYLPRRLRLALKVLIELLAGVPSVVYGLLGILFLRDWIYVGFARFDPLSGDTLLTAGVLLARGEQGIAAERIEPGKTDVDPVAKKEDAEQSVNHGRDSGQQLDQHLQGEPQAAGQVFGG